MNTASKKSKNTKDNRKSKNKTKKQVLLDKKFQNLKHECKMLLEVLDMFDVFIYVMTEVICYGRIQENTLEDLKALLNVFIKVAFVCYKMNAKIITTLENFIETD